MPGLLTTDEASVSQSGSSSSVPSAGAEAAISLARLDSASRNAAHASASAHSPVRAWHLAWLAGVLPCAPETRVVSGVCVKIVVICERLVQNLLGALHVAPISPYSLLLLERALEEEFAACGGSWEGVEAMYRAQEKENLAKLDERDAAENATLSLEATALRANRAAKAPGLCVACDTKPHGADDVFCSNHGCHAFVSVTTPASTIDVGGPTATMADVFWFSVSAAGLALAGRLGGGGAIGDGGVRRLGARRSFLGFAAGAWARSR